MNFILLSAAFPFFFLFLLEIIAYTIRWYTISLSPPPNPPPEGGGKGNGLKGCVDFLIEYLCSCVAIFLLLVDYLSLPFALLRPITPTPSLRSGQALTLPLDGGGGKSVKGESCDGLLTTDSGRNPVLLVFGYMARGFHMALLRYRLKRDGWNNVFFFLCRPSMRGILHVANGLKNMVEKLSEVSPTKKADLVCHSLGGVVALYYISTLGGSDKIQHLVNLGAPFKGSKLWRFSPRQWCRKILKPDNKFLKGLTEKIPPQLKITSIYSSFDELVLPYHSCKLEMEGVENIEIDSVGHQRLVFSKRVYLLIRDSLMG